MTTPDYMERAFAACTGALHYLSFLLYDEEEFEKFRVANNMRDTILSWERDYASAKEATECR